MVTRSPVILGWQPSSFSGWGVYGLNLFLEWAGDHEWFPLTSVPFQLKAIVLDALRRRRIEPFLQESVSLIDARRSATGGRMTTGGTVLHALDHHFGRGPAAPDVAVRGRTNAGVVFLENTSLPDAAGAASAYDLIVTGSRWNEEVLRGAGVEHVRTVWQGIDPTLFHPGPRSGWYRDRFVVFSGGKLELRKGQDIVLRAFRAFAQRHPESLLVTAWQGPWPHLARTFDGLGSVAPVPFTDDGRLNVKGWAVANGIAADQFLGLGPVANALMPTILREMDVALFPSRAEGGTNLVAMETMACGIPCIVSRNTGHRDIMTAPDAAEPNCYPLERQAPVDDSRGTGTDGWGESDVEEAVEALELVWRDRDEASARGARGAAAMAALTWSSQARELKNAITAATPAGA